MLKHFTNRGYPTHLVRNAIQKALNIDRNSLLLPKTDPTNKKITIPFILTYNPCNPPISDILKKYTRLLHLSDDLKQIADSQMLIVHKRATNLKQILVKTDINPVQIALGSNPCQKPCATCPYMQKQPVSPHGKRSKSSQLKDAFPAKLKMSFT